MTPKNRVFSVSVSESVYTPTPNTEKKLVAILWYACSVFKWELKNYQIIPTRKWLIVSNTVDFAFDVLQRWKKMTDWHQNSIYVVVSAEESFFKLAYHEPKQCLSWPQNNALCWYGWKLRIVWIKDIYCVSF